MGETVSFESYITRAIDIRSEEMGKFNIPNAVCYANLYKHMMALQDSEDATSYHHQATEIFSRFPSDHPSAWIIHLSNGLFFYEKRSTEEFINEMDYCIKVATKRYSPNHISILKIMFQYGKLLIGLEEYNRALNIFLKLETQLEESLSLSLKDGKIEKETDDEKIPLRKNLYVELKSIYSRSKNETDGGSLSELKRC
jgi:tetratricopeptide (TPR) repeat protein